MATFAQAFAKARKEMGAGKTFTFKGKKYTTDRADDKKKSKAETAPPKRPAAPKQQGRLINATSKPKYSSKIGPNKVAAAPPAAGRKPAYNSKVGPKKPSLLTRVGMAAGKKVGRMMGK